MQIQMLLIHDPASAPGGRESGWRNSCELGDKTMDLTRESVRVPYSGVSCVIAHFRRLARQLMMTNTVPPKKRTGHESAVGKQKRKRRRSTSGWR